MTMVERVALAIASQDFGPFTKHWAEFSEDVHERYFGLARAAIEAMKEPTERMLDAYWEQTGESILMRPRVHVRAQRMFEAMVQAALEEGE